MRPFLSKCSSGLATGIVAILTFWLVASYNFGFGVDQGGHLAFTEQLVEQQQWPLRPDALSFFISTDYPPGTHLLGAAIGAMFGSSIKGMFVALGLAFVSIYCSLFYLTRRAIASA